MGVSSVEDPSSTCCLSPKIYQPAGDMDGLAEVPRKKKMFSSSSFYEEPRCIYPTVEEQVKLCRRIAESLSDDCNVRSKGASMFFRRVKKAEKWIVAQSNGQDEEGPSPENGDPSKLPYVRPSTSREGGKGLRLILDPRQIVDLDVLLRQGVDIVQHDALSPEVCHGLAKDLTSTNGRGGQLFAKRKMKSEEWVVDEEKVKRQLQARYHEDSGLPDLDPKTVAESVIRTAEAKVMSYPRAVPQVPVIESLDWSSGGHSQACRARAPKGWTPSTEPASDVARPPEASTDGPCPVALRRTQSFNNFNSSPRAWDAQRYSQFRPVKPVRPPSLLMVQ